MRAIDGDDADDLGVKVFSLKADGVNLKITCETQGGFKTYTSSKFSMPRAIDGVTDKNIDEILGTMHDLEKINPVKSYDDLKKILDEHFLCVESTSNETQEVAVKPMERQSIVTAAVTSKPSAAVDDDEVKRLLDGLDE
jgi:hypothetical protein